jgi:hypothetical protein
MGIETIEISLNPTDDFFYGLPTHYQRASNPVLLIDDF